MSVAPDPSCGLSEVALERTGLIAHKRGVITILDREALEGVSNGTYARPR